MTGPYREAVAAEIMEADTREGKASLEVAPRHVLLRVGEQLTLSVTERFASLTRIVRNKRKKRSLALSAGARLLVAHTVPTDDIGIWHEAKPGVVTRLFGLHKHSLGSGADITEERRQLDRLIAHLKRALSPHGQGVTRALEVGVGADRVLIMDFGDRLRFHVRRLFREYPRPAFEVRRDGVITVLHPAVAKGKAKGDSDAPGELPATRHKEQFVCTFRLGVSTMGDYIRFVSAQGDDLGRISLPWIRPEDRAHLATIIGDTIASTS